MATVRVKGLKYVAWHVLGYLAETCGVQNGEAGTAGKYANRMSDVVEESAGSTDESQLRSHSVSDVLLHTDGQCLQLCVPTVGLACLPYCRRRPSEN